jgi:endonuclease/exonuclease/phosphatase family metal-dependent hydrolase
MASVNLQTPEAGQFENEKKVMKGHIDTFFKGVEIYAWQETKANWFGGLRKGGDLVVKEIHRDVFGDNGKYKWVLPTEAFGGDIENTNCDSSIMYDSSIWSLQKKGSAAIVTDQYDTRTVVWGVFSRAGGTLAVFNTHATWGSSTGGQFDKIRAEIDKVMEEFPGVSVILVGDFNNQDWWNFKVTPPLRKPEQATGGNMRYDWVLTTPTPEEPTITYGQMGHNGRALATGSDHEPVLIEARFLRGNIIQG